MSENEQAMADAAAALTNELIGGVAVAEPEVESVEATTEDVVEQPAAEEAAPVATFDLNPELPDDLAAELAEAEIDEAVEAEVAAYKPPEDEWGNPVEVDEDAVREAVKLRKRNEWLEQQLVETKRGAWEKEAEKFFPLSKHALGSIQASSRRAFLKAAKAEHDRILPHVQSYLAEAKTVVDAEKDSATAEARAVVADAWGTPVTGPDTGAVEQADQQKRVVQAREKVRTGKGGLKDVFAEMLRG